LKKVTDDKAGFFRDAIEKAFVFSITKRGGGWWGTLFPKLLQKKMVEVGR
jgi:hypothetical protein